RTQVLCKGLNVFLFHHARGRIAVRLEYITYTVTNFLNGLHKGSQLMRVVGVIIDNQPLPVVKVNIKPPLKAGELTEHPGNIFILKTQFLQECYAGKCIIQIILPRYKKVEPCPFNRKNGSEWLQINRFCTVI